VLHLPLHEAAESSIKPNNAVSLLVKLCSLTGSLTDSEGGESDVVGVASLRRSSGGATRRTLGGAGKKFVDGVAMNKLNRRLAA